MDSTPHIDYPDLMGLFQDFCRIHYGHPNKQSSVEGDTAQCLFLCQVRQAVDMWSTGCILGEMLTRRWGRWLSSGCIAKFTVNEVN
jgi:serine/threonine protein kinase